MGLDEQVQLLRVVSIVGYSLGGIFALTAVLLFVRFQVIQIIGELTGVTARKGIRKNEEMFVASGTSSTGADGVSAGRKRREPKREKQPAAPPKGSETMPLAGAETMPLAGAETMPLAGSETMPLAVSPGDTGELIPAATRPDSSFVPEQEILLVDTGSIVEL